MSGVIGGAGSKSGIIGQTELDYEEGTFTPVLGGHSGTSGQSYGAQAGSYIKIGKMVTVTCMTSLSNKGTVSGNAVVSGFPYALKGSSAYRCSAALSYISYWDIAGKQMQGLMYENDTRVSFIRTSTSNGAVGAVLAAEIGNSEVVTTISYRTN